MKIKSRQTIYNDRNGRGNSSLGGQVLIGQEEEGIFRDDGYAPHPSHGDGGMISFNHQNSECLRSVCFPVHKIYLKNISHTQEKVCECC